MMLSAKIALRTSEMCKETAEILITKAVKAIEYEESSAEIMTLNMAIVKALGDGIKAIDEYYQITKHCIEIFGDI